MGKKIIRLNGKCLVLDETELQKKDHQRLLKAYELIRGGTIQSYFSKQDIRYSTTNEYCTGSGTN
jgi:hypothetical protein